MVANYRDLISQTRSYRRLAQDGRVRLWHDEATIGCGRIAFPSVVSGQRTGSTQHYDQTNSRVPIASAALVTALVES